MASGERGGRYACLSEHLPEASQPVVICLGKCLGGSVIVAPIGVDAPKNHSVHEHLLPVEGADIHLCLFSGPRDAGEAGDGVLVPALKGIKDHLGDSGAFDQDVGLQA